MYQLKPVDMETVYSLLRIISTLDITAILAPGYPHHEAPLVSFSSDSETERTVSTLKVTSAHGL